MSQAMQETSRGVMDRLQVVSSNVRSVGYDIASHTLEVEYDGGGIYQYFGVPEVEFNRLMSATSKGRYLNDQIKCRYEFRQVQ